MAISSKKIQPSLLKDLWITAGIFSSHYLLERLPQAGPKAWPSDEEVLSYLLKKCRKTDTLLYVYG